MLWLKQLLWEASKVAYSFTYLIRDLYFDSVINYLGKVTKISTKQLELINFCLSKFLLC